jgi:membrane peptidoglycan carboxypeptidase
VANWQNNFRMGTNSLRQDLMRSGNTTTFVLSWSNPVTNSCGSNAVVVLQRALGLRQPVTSTQWTNIFTNSSGSVRVTNSVTSSNQVFYRLQVR